AIDSRSKTVEDVLEILKKGTVLWKVRSFSKWYRRKYILDHKNGTLRYEPSHKMPCYSVNQSIVVDDIVDIRKGWKTDTFNKIERRINKRTNKSSGKKPLVEEATCFSIIHGRNKQSLDLVAPNADVADLWVRGLKHLITVLHGLKQEERFERWLKQQFEEADVDNNGCLNFEECLKLLKQLNVKLPKPTCSRHLLKKILSEKYTKEDKEMTAEELCNFIRKEQNCKEFTIEQCKTLIETFEQSQLKENGKVSVIGFTNILMSKQFEIFNMGHTVVYQDMTHPLSHYYIASSHNTYLTGNQLSGESSVEVDCWDGPDGDPIIYHGYTLTSKILFRDVLMDAIKPYAFHVSEYPVILSLENHCSEKQQETLAKHLKNILGDMLYMESPKDDMKFLPSPEALKRKILVKAKKAAPSGKVVESDSEDEGEGDRGEAAPAAQKSKVVAQGLSSLVNLCQAVHFHGFEDARLNGKCFQMSSFSEAKALDLMQNSGKEFVAYNARQLSRIYPSGARTGSSNYKPTPLWNAGCQIVALNYQSKRRPIFLNESKFRQNGGCGYILKPKYLCGESSEYDPIAVPLDSGQHIPKPDQDIEGEVVDPYVTVKIVGHPSDAYKAKTEAIRNNELAMVHFVIKDLSTTGKDAMLGMYALPFTSIQQGYRHIYLLDYMRELVAPATLFVHIAIK
ncbi:1-phosphatidylinositol 4, partial [Blattella germanica]